MKNIINFEKAIQINQKAKEEKIQREKEFNETLTEAREDVMHRIFEEDEPFTYCDIEEIMSSHGLEMDYIEDFLI